MFYVGGHHGRCEYFAAGHALRESFDAGDVAAKGDVIVSNAVWDEVRKVSHGKPLRAGFHSLRSMEKTFRKRSKAVGRRAVRLSPGCLKMIRSYAPPVLLSAHELESAFSYQSVRGWTVSIVQASVVFINLGIGSFMDIVSLDCAKINTAVVTVQRIMHQLQGCIHRFTVDDKGCVMKVVFGAQLPHEDQPYRALLAALQVRHALSLQGIQPAVGVASGESLIGPVGSATRQEFTVHGDKIILAARLMQLAASYGGMVLCDEQTFVATRDELRFVVLRPVHLKGKSATVQPYRPVASSELLEKPILSSKPEGSFCAVSESIRRTLDECTAWLASSSPAFHAVVITGQHGSGKTQLLMQARARCEAFGRVLHVRCREHEAWQRGALLRRLFAQLCGQDVWPSLQHITPMLAGLANDAETALLDYELRMLQSHSAAGSECRQAAGASTGGAMDPMASANLPSCTEREIGCDGDARTCAAATKDSGRLILFIDDIHHADAHSCELLRRLASSKPDTAMLVLTCREPRVSLASATPSTTGDETQLTPGHRLVHGLTSGKRDGLSATAVHLRPLGGAACDQLACAELGVAALPEEVRSLLVRRSGGSPLLCQSIARHLVDRGAVLLGKSDDNSATCSMQCRTPSTSEVQAMDEAATEAVVRARHSVLCVKLAELTVLQQLVLKTMSLLAEPCSQGLIMHAMPLQVHSTEVLAQLRLLREAHFIGIPHSHSHRRSLPGVLSPGSSGDAVYTFVDVGMREVCQHLMVESQRRQIRLRAAAANESKQVLGGLGDSLSSSFGGGSEELARSFSPSMLRSAREQANTARTPLRHRSFCVTEPDDGSFGEGFAETNQQWWLSRSLSHLSPQARRRGAAKYPSPSRLHQHTRPRREHSSLSKPDYGRISRSALSQMTGSSSPLALIRFPSPCKSVARFSTTSRRSSRASSAVTRL